MVGSSPEMERSGDRGGDRRPARLTAGFVLTGAVSLSGVSITAATESAAMRDCAEAAQKAFSDALRLDPSHPPALMARARMALLTGDLRQALLDTQDLIDAFPDSEAPWQLRAALAQRLGRPDFQIAGLEAAVERWPSDARSWSQLAQLYGARGESARAAEARQCVQRLQPSLLQEK